MTDIYERGLNLRKVSKTDMNQDSSRSHLIFSVVITNIDNTTGKKSIAKISFVDLAGSEAANKSNPNYNQRKEGQAINQSLLALN